MLPAALDFTNGAAFPAEQWLLFQQQLALFKSGTNCAYFGGREKSQLMALQAEMEGSRLSG